MGTILLSTPGRTAETEFRPSFRQSSLGALVSIVNRLLVWQERARQRAALASLEPHLLKDIGVSAADAEREARKPFWKA